jgi:hypothetical protein
MLLARCEAMDSRPFMVLLGGYAPNIVGIDILSTAGTFVPVRLPSMVEGRSGRNSLAPHVPHTPG